MDIINLNRDKNLYIGKKANILYTNTEQLLLELKNHKITEENINIINKLIDDNNKYSGLNKDFKTAIRKTLFAILELLEKKQKLVPKNHFQKKWQALGLATFGIPFGVTFGLLIDNMAFLGIGLPIGMAIGIVIGKSKDKDALKNGNQLNFYL